MRTVNILFQHLGRLAKNPFFAGSAVMLLGINIHNAGQFLYHILAVKLLSEAHYGDLAAIIAIFGLLAIVQQSFGLAIVKFIASAKDSKEAHNLARWVFFWSLWAAVGVAVLILILSPFLGRFLHIAQATAIYLFAPVVLLAFVSNTGRALLQGFVRFTQLVASLIAEVGIKILLTVALLYLGYALFGAMIGLLIGVSCGLLIVLFSLRDTISGKRGARPDIMPLVSYSLPVLVQSVAVTSMYSMDIILVKHFFHPDIAGVYAGLAKLGTIALFVASPITNVMFPLVTKKYSHGQPYHQIFYLSLASITVLSLLVVAVYRLFAPTIVGLLFKPSFVDQSYLLWWFASYMLLLGLAMLFTQFYLSVGKTRQVLLFAAAAVAQVVLILLFHDTLLTVIQVSAVAAALLVASLVLYFPWHNHRV